MRNSKRIPIALDALQNNYVDFLKHTGIEVDDVDLLIDLFTVKREEIEMYWNKYPDLRLTQVLVNFGVLPNLPGFWYYCEETDYLVKKGYVKFEDIHFWGVNYTKEGVLLPETIFKPLKELETDHIRNILKHFEERHALGVRGLSPGYLEYFEKRLSEDGSQQTEELLNKLFKDGKQKD